MLLATVILGTIAGAVESTDPPPLPPGYPTNEALVAAILSGKIKLVDLQNITVPDTVEERLGIAYGNGGGRALHLDLYLPKERNEPAPAILFLHGGGWKHGQRDQMKYYCIQFAARGFVTATATYRLSGEAPFPAAVQDVKCAVRWLRANESAFKIDPDRIVVSGNSAGGHLAMMIGYADDPVLEGSGGHAGISSRVRAVVNFYGPTDLTTDFAREQGLVKSFMDEKSIEEAPENYRLGSPVIHLTPDDPPTLIFHGTIDDTVPVAQADRLAEKLKSLGIAHVYERYEGWPHTLDLALEVNRRCVYQMERFFQQHVTDLSREK
jgi:acetyl esterase/lipase